MPDPASLYLFVVDPADPRAQAAMRAYFAELDERFPGGFDPGPTALSDVAAMAAPAGSFVIAVEADAAVACGGVQVIPPGLAEIKRMWVAESWRGVGLGARLLARLEDEVRRLGHDRVVLDTHGTLSVARKMYAAHGYHPIERYNDNPYAQAWFGKDL